MTGARVLVLAGLLGIVASCGEERRPSSRAGSATESRPGRATEPWFDEIAASAGVRFTCRSGHREDFLFPEIILGGSALFDMDDDDDLDLFLVQGKAPAGPAGRLFRNDGGLRFVDATRGVVSTPAAYGIGVATGDYDADGDVDLYLTNVGPNALLRNDGEGRFRDVTAVSLTGDPAWSTSAGFLDYDVDGDLDLWVVNYVNWTVEGERHCYNDFGTRDYCLPTNYGAPACDTLYRNEGNGVYTDVTDAAGLRSAFGNGLGIACADFDGDGRVDVFVANDTMLDQLWINRGDGRFEDEALVRGCAVDEHGKAKAGMGVATGDVDDDGDLDLLVVNLDRESDSFFLNEGDFFTDNTAALGLAVVSRSFTRFGVGLADFDNDGSLDLYLANGRVNSMPEPRAEDPYAEGNLLFRGSGHGRFEVVEPAGGTAQELIFTSRGAAFGDIDGDGGVDVVVVNRDGPAHVLRNAVASRGGWIRFRLLETGGGDALGATVTATIGEVRVRRDVQSAYSYASANDPRVHFGLGAEKFVRDVRVRWVGGVGESFGDFAAGRTVVLRRGTGRARD